MKFFGEFSREKFSHKEVAADWGLDEIDPAKSYGLLRDQTSGWVIISSKNSVSGSFGP